MNSSIDNTMHALVWMANTEIIEVATLQVFTKATIHPATSYEVDHTWQL